MSGKLLLFCVFCVAPSLCTPVRDVCHIDSEASEYDCTWDGNPIYGASSIDSAVERITFDRLQNSRVDCEYFPNLKDLFYSESPFDNIVGLCDHVFNVNSRVTVHALPIDGDSEIVETCYANSDSASTESTRFDHARISIESTPSDHARTIGRVITDTLPDHAITAAHVHTTRLGENVVSSRTAKIVSSRTTKITATSTGFIGENIFKLIDNELVSRSIPWSNCLSLGCDNANVMVGHKTGVFAFVKEKQPQVYLSGCCLHLIQIAARHAAKSLPAIEDVLIDIYYYFNKSDKRKSEFKGTQEIYNIYQKRMLKHVCTRWLSIGRCIVRSIHNWDALKVYFKTQKDIIDTKRQRRSEKVTKKAGAKTTEKVAGAKTTAVAKTTARMAGAKTTAVSKTTANVTGAKTKAKVAGAKTTAKGGRGQAYKEVAGPTLQRWSRLQSYGCSSVESMQSCALQS